MKSYIISIICIGVIGSIISLLAPEGEGGGLSRHVKLAAGVCVILVCFAPAVEAIEWLRDLDIESVRPVEENDRTEYESIFDSTYREAEIDELCEGIKAVVAERSGLDPLSFEVSARLSGEGENKRLSRVTVTLYGSAIFADTGEIERYLTAMLGCEIVTTTAPASSDYTSKRSKDARDSDLARLATCR